MDMEIDGGTNTVYQVDTQPLPAGPENPYNNAFTAVAKPLLSETDGEGVVNSASARHWRIANTNKVNHVGHAPAYLLVPGETVSMMAGPDAAVRGRAGFTPEAALGHPLRRVAVLSGRRLPQPEPARRGHPRLGRGRSRDRR